MDRETRNLQHTKAGSKTFATQLPSVSSMENGDERYVWHGDELRLYTKQQGQLFYRTLVKYTRDESASTNYEGFVELATTTECQTGTDTTKAVTPDGLTAAFKEQSWTQDDGLYIATDEIRARDSGGLLLRDDSGTSGLFVADGGRVGVGTTSLQSHVGVLHISKGNNADTNWDPNATVVIEDDTHAYLVLRVPNTSACGVRFSDPDAAAPGGFNYDHATDVFKFSAAGAVGLSLNSVGILAGYDGLASSAVHGRKEDTNTTAVIDVLRADHSISVGSTAGDGIGTGIALYAEDASGNIDLAGRINALFPVATHASQTGRVDITALSASAGTGISVLNTGLVGIGTINPLTRLQCHRVSAVGTTCENIITLYNNQANTDTGTGVGIIFDHAFNTPGATAGRTARIRSVSELAWSGKVGLAFDTGDGTSLIENFRIGNTGNITIGSGASGLDYSITVNGEHNDGVITWMEDDDYFKFSDDINFGGATNFLTISDTDGDITWGGTFKKKLTLRPILTQTTAKVGGTPSQVTRGLNIGYSLPVWSSDNEELYWRMRIPIRWDGSTDPQFGCCVTLAAAETVGHKFKFQLEWQTGVAGSVLGTTTSNCVSEQTILTGRDEAYDIYFIFFTIDQNDANNTLTPGNMLQARLRRIAASADEAHGEIIVWDWATMWCVNNVYGGWSVGTNAT